MKWGAKAPVATAPGSARGTASDLWQEGPVAPLKAFPPLSHQRLPSASWSCLMYTERLRYRALAAVLVFSMHYLIEIEGIISVLQMKKQVQKGCLSQI